MSEPELVHEVFAAMDAGDFVRAERALDEAFQLHYLGLPNPMSRGEFLELIRASLLAFPDMRHEVQQVLPSRDHLTVRVAVHATHRGEYEGVPATGRQVTVGAIHILRLSGGKIAEWWAAEDDLGLLRQIGMVIAPPAATT